MLGAVNDNILRTAVIVYAAMTIPAEQAAAPLGAKFLLAIAQLARGQAALLPGSEGAIPNGRLPCLAWASNGWLYYFAVGPAITSIGAWRPGQRAAGRLRLDIDWAVDVVPNTLAAN